MNNGKIIMKNMKYNFAFGITLICMVLLTACLNILEPAEIKSTFEEGHGKININFAGGHVRTIFPSAVFDKYVYTFTKTGEESGVEKIPDNVGFFSLEVGTYTVEVQAFIGTEGAYTLAAEGKSLPFTVHPGINDPVSVGLFGVVTEGKGEINYTITFPAGAEAEITLKKWPDMGDITLAPSNLTEGNGKTQTLELETGTYLLTALIEKNELYAGVSEAIHILPLLSTVFTKDFDEADFLHTQFTVTFHDNEATGGTAPAVQAVNAGSSLVLPDPETLYKTFYSFGGWNTNADGMGITYSTGDSYTPTGNVTLYAQWDPIPVTGVSLNRSSINLTLGNIETLSVIISPNNATNQNVEWSSSDPSVATVFPNGDVIAVSHGTAVIIATTIDGEFRVTCTVNVTVDLAVAQRAVPVAASNNPAEPVILDYFRIEDRHWYIIDAGYIRNAFIARLGIAHYNGVTPTQLTISEVTESNVTISVTTTLSETVGFINSEEITRGIAEEVTRAITAGVTVGTTATIEGNIGIAKGSVEQSLEASLETTYGEGITKSEQVARLFSVSNERTIETSMTSIESFTRSLGNQVSYLIGENGEPPGYYRYALYSVADVYFIISTCLDNENWLSWDIITSARQSDYLPHFEYSPDGRFDISPTGNLIVFSEDFYRDLPKPTGYRLITSVNIENSGMVVHIPNSTRYNDGENVTLMAVPEPGYEFVNWTGNGAPTGSAAYDAGITVAMDSDLTLIANFRIMNTLTTSVNIPGSGTISQSPNQPAYVPGTPVTLTATANTGYIFVNWTGSGAPAGSAANNASITINMNSNLTLTANFRNLNPQKQSFPFTSSQQWTLPANMVSASTTIEIYAHGAGGGGQGGLYSWRIGTDRRGTGGSGGGGAATYIMFETNSQISFNVEIGKGGEGGEPRDSGISTWSAGYPGSPGGSTSVTWGNNTITAQGGHGGGGVNDRDLSGGTGGSATTTWPSYRLDQFSAAGVNGTNGNDSQNIASRGGNVAAINRGSMVFGGGGGASRPGGLAISWQGVNGTLGGGGSGAHGGAVDGKNRGGDGGDGFVIIVVHWNE